ncbi:hypothetical protein LCL61_23840 [Amycolatopsis coloradensis]|uniref:Uncharacterized protein n=1 Tax=Amycolatopsis coloradensis TaxID=76021 RepID=A0ACD5BGS4_9PSEU
MADNGTATKQGARTATVNLPFVTAQFRAPELHMPRAHIPNRQEIGSALRVVGSYLPSPKQTVYYGGLALMAAAELIEWPVAAAVAIGTAVAGGGEKPPNRDEKPASGRAARPSERGAKR